MATRKKKQAAAPAAIKEPKTPWNPSRGATKKVLDPLPAPTTCPNCQGTVSIYDHQSIYGATYGNWPWVYACDDRTHCDSYVGMHPFTNIPLGTLANKATRDARMVSKKQFFAVMKHHNVSRNVMYAALADHMQIPKSECHFGWFSIEQCEQAAKCLRLMKTTLHRPEKKPKPAETTFIAKILNWIAQ